MHQTAPSGIQCLCTMRLYQSIILWIFRPTWKRPHCLKTPVMEGMESHSSCDLKFQSNSGFHHNMPAHTVFSIIPMVLINNPECPWAVWELAIGWWFRSGWWVLIWNKVVIPSGLRFIKTGVQILVGDINVFCMQHVHKVEISSISHRMDDTVEWSCHSGYSDHQDWFTG